MTTFEFDGAKYAKASNHQKEWGSRLIADLELTGNESVLDLGCGDGVLTEQLARQVPAGRLLGIDASEGMLEQARKLERENLAFALMDINEIDFEAEFDLVFSNSTLNWIKDHRRLMANVLRALKPGGRARFNYAGDGNCSHLNAIVREVMQLPRFSGYFASFEWPWFMPVVDEYDALVREFDWAEVRVWGENADRYFPDAEAMIRWIDQPSLVPFLAYVDDEDRRAFRDEVVRRMIATTRQPDGTFFETFRRVHVWAKRA